MAGPRAGPDAGPCVAVPGKRRRSRPEKNDAGKTILRIGAQPFPLYSSLLLAHKLGYFEEELSKVNATYTWTLFNSGPLVNEAVAAGNADVGFMADMPAILARSSGQDIQIFAHVAHGEKALALLVGKDSLITSLEQIKGKKIAYVKGSYAQHLTALLLKKAGLSFNDIASVNLAAGDVPAALETRQIDGTVIWEQFISQLATSGRARVIADGTGIKKGNMVSYVVRGFGEAHPEVLAAYVKAGQRGSDYIAAHPREAAAVLAPDLRIESAVMEAIFGNLVFYQSLTRDDIQEIRKVKDYILAEKIIVNDVDIDRFINTRYLREAGL
ncbi:MAG: aliphatic sulfonate ABC transporter substrate-binding protein [Candidatus Accumulibacter sp.]|nr:aliphatic sulfonate ABC transporter substrate-binding protein [Accumulibacter sp.]